MAVTGTDLLLIERSGTLYKATAADIAAYTGGGGGGATIVSFTNQAAFDAYTPATGEIAVLDGDGLANISLVTDAAAPATPAADSVVIYGAKECAHDMPAWKEPGGIVERFQGWLGRKSVAWAMPTGAGTGIQTMGTSLSATGTATTASMAATNIHTATRRLNYLVTTAATSAIAGWRQAFANFFIGAPGANFGGFHMVFRFGRPTGAAAISTLRAFTGLTSATGAFTDTNPTTYNMAMIGVGCDAADTNYHIFHSSGGIATKVDTGIAKNDADATEMYELQLYAQKGRGGQVDYVFIRLSDGVTFAGSITTNMPTNTTMLCPRGNYSVGGTSSVIGYSLAGFWCDDA